VNPLVTTISGVLGRDAGDWVYVPVDVPPGVARLEVELRYDRPDVEVGELGNACDLGVFDERGVGPGAAGFRGWSGGARSGFFISAAEATPGYLPGPIRPGRWHVLLAPYQVAPAGLRYDLDVTCTPGPDGPTTEATYPPVRVGPTGARWVRGDCHLHSVYSDGVRTPEQLAAAARAAGLDFIVSTDHNTSSAHRQWAPHAGDDLLIGLGEEVTTRTGHWLALGLPPETVIDWRFRAGGDGFAVAAARVRQLGAIAVAAHPFAPCLGCRFKHDLGHADVVEVWNGPWTLDDEAALLAWDNLLGSGPGHWLPAMGNSDSHALDDTVGLPQTVVFVDDLSVDAITDGLRTGRSWIAESAAVTLTFTATTAMTGTPLPPVGIGGHLTAADDAAVDVRLDVDGVADGLLLLVTDQGVVRQERCDSGGHGGLGWRTSPGRSRYVRAELRHPVDGDTEPTSLRGPMAALTNPIWLGGPGQS
jgi:hypothetical protein